MCREKNRKYMMKQLEEAMEGYKSSLIRRGEDKGEDRSQSSRSDQTGATRDHDSGSSTAMRFVQLAAGPLRVGTPSSHGPPTSSAQLRRGTLKDKRVLRFEDDKALCKTVAKWYKKNLELWNNSHSPNDLNLNIYWMICVPEDAHMTFSQRIDVISANITRIAKLPHKRYVTSPPVPSLMTDQS